MARQVPVETPERQLLAILRGEPVATDAFSTPAQIARFQRAARFHGLMRLLDARMRLSAQPGWPDEIAGAYRTEALQQAAYELAHRAELAKVLAALHDAGVRALLLKGTALAYGLYANPTLRPRGDTDLLIPFDSRTVVDATLSRLGYARYEGVQGAFVSYQSTWERTDQSGATHSLDVHWRINNSQMLARLLGYEELAARAVAIPRLGPHAYGLAAVHALLFACIHRAGHAHAPYFVDGVAHPAADRIIWLYDVHLLVDAMSAGELEEFATIASSKRIKAICRDTLELCRERFSTEVPAGVFATLAAEGPPEPSSRYFNGGPLLQLIGDFLALENWRDRTRWVGEMAFPGESYTRRKYPKAEKTWLPILYARRAFSGVWKRLVRGDARE